MNDVKDKSLHAFGFSTRTRRPLAKLGILTIGDLTQWYGKDLLEMRGFGERCLKEVEEKLAAVGLYLRQNWPRVVVLPSENGKDFRIVIPPDGVSEANAVQMVNAIIRLVKLDEGYSEEHLARELGKAGFTWTRKVFAERWD